MLDTIRRFPVRGAGVAADRLSSAVLVAPLLTALWLPPALAQPTLVTPKINVVVPLTDVPVIAGVRPVRLVPRVLPPKTYPAPIDNKRFSATQIVVKFHEGTAVRVRNGIWVAAEEPGATVDDARLAVRSLNRGILREALTAANGIVGGMRENSIRPMFAPLAELRLAAIKAEGEASGRELADLNLYYFVVLPKPDAALAQKIIAGLLENPAIEQVYAQPIPRDAADIPPPTTINITAMQGYEHAAPGGIDVDFARAFSGGMGEQVRIIDVEAGWNLDHEDLPGGSSVFSWHGINFGGNHGTAVAGELWGVPNAYGVTGIAPRSGMGWSSVVGAQFPNVFYSPASAIANAAADLAAGDVILIEQHMPDFTVNSVACINACNPSQCGYVPVELYGAEFAAISTATARGIVVVEAAGNGMTNLDAASFNGAFNRSVRDSGAILVGASNGSGSLTPACFTNSGSRVDLHSWGFGVATTGYGNAPGDESAPPQPAFAANGSDALQWYTAGFSGTSSASPIVAGAVALVQSIRASAGLQKLTPGAMRTLLTTTGTPQAAGVPIGPQPNLLAALRATLPDVARGRSPSLPSHTTPAQSLTGSVGFVNDGPQTWTAADHRVTCAWSSAPSTPPTVTSLSGSVTHGQLAQFNWTAAVPAASGVHTLRCDMLAGGASIGVAEASTIAAAANQFGAAVTSLTLPATMPFGLNGNAAAPRTGQAVVKNSGTQIWDASVLNQLALRVSGSLVLTPLTVPVPAQVAPGGSVTINLEFECEAPGPKSVTAQMTLGGVPFGGSATKTTKCMGTIHNPAP